MANDDVPSWLIEIIIAWGAWASGSPVNLKPRTFWQVGSAREYLVTQDDIELMERAVLELRADNFRLAAILEYKYKTNRIRTTIDVEHFFRISNSSARQKITLAEFAVYQSFNRLKKAA